MRSWNQVMNLRWRFVLANSENLPDMGKVARSSLREKTEGIVARHLLLILQLTNSEDR